MSSAISVQMFPSAPSELEIPIWTKPMVATELQPLSTLALAAIIDSGHPLDESPYIKTDNGYEGINPHMLRQARYPKTLYIGAASLLLIQGISAVMGHVDFRKNFSVVEGFHQKPQTQIEGTLQLSPDYTIHCSNILGFPTMISSLTASTLEEIDPNIGNHEITLRAQSLHGLDSYSLRLKGQPRIPLGNDFKCGLSIEIQFSDFHLSADMPERLAAVAMCASGQPAA